MISLKSYLSVLKYIVLLLLGISLLVLAFRGQDIDLLWNDIRHADYIWVMASLLACFMAHIVRALRWRMMIGALGYGFPSVLHSCYAVLIGYMANLAFPRMGELSRCVVIHKTNAIPVVKLIGTVLVERVIDLLMLGIVTALTIFLQFDLLSEFIYRNVLVKLTGNAGDLTILVIGGLILSMALVFFYILMKRKKWGIRNRIFRLFMDMKSGILSVKSLENKSYFIAGTVSIWFLYGLSAWFCFFALEATAVLGMLEALSTLVFSSLGMIAPVQGGIGAFHFMVSEGLMIYGIPKADGLVYALLIHSSQTILILLSGAISLILLMIRSPKTIAGNEQASAYKE